MEEEKKKEIIASSFARTDSALAGKQIKVNWLSDNNPAIGYTANGIVPIINIVWNNTLLSSFSEEEKLILRFGINGHELLHQLLTDFAYVAKKAEKYSGYENTFCLIVNLLEDPAIEFFAPSQFSGALLNSLNYTIEALAKKSPGIGNEKDAFSQYVNAFIDVGDLGYFRGQFTFPEAEKLFWETLPLFNLGITTGDAPKRVDIAEEIFLKIWDILPDKQNQPPMPPEYGNKSSQGQKEAQEKAKNEEKSLKGNSQIQKRREALKKEGASEKESLYKEIETLIKENSSSEEKNVFYDENLFQFYEIDCSSQTPYCLAQNEIWLEKKLAKEISKLLTEKQETQACTSGKYNITRGYTKNTVRVFDKKKTLKQATVAVTLMIDSSGSMKSKGKIKFAQQAANIFNVALQTIPQVNCRIVGFCCGYLAIKHYIHKDFDKKAEEIILNAYGQNLDGLSIRKEVKILKKRPETIKLLIVISDGLPNCPLVVQSDEAMTDLIQTIKKARKKVNVFGIGLSDSCNPEILSKIYKSDFIYAKDPKDLTSILQNQFSKKLKKILEN